MEFTDVEALQVASELHRRWGSRFAKLGNYTAAIDAYRRSLEEGGDDLRTLVGLCEALLRSGRYDEANAVAQKCATIDPDNYAALWMRVETLYGIGEFGGSLSCAYRGYRRRRYPFESGIYRARETIQGCIGCNTSDSVLVELIPWMRKLEQRSKLIANSTNQDEFQDLDDDDALTGHAEIAKYRVNDCTYQREEREEKFNRMLTKRYQGSLANDILYLQGLQLNPGLNSTSKENNQQLLALIQGYLTRSTESTIVARTRKPLYVFRIKRREITTPGLRKSQLNDRQLRRHNIVIEVNSLLMRLHRARQARDYPLFFKYVDRAKSKLDGYSDSIFPQRADCLKELYRMVGRAYIDPRDVTEITSPNKRELYLKHHLGMRQATLPRDECIGWCTPMSKVLLRRRLALTSDPLELAWLFHELSRVHAVAGAPDLARYYARKSRDWAAEAGDDIWRINANHLLVRVELHQRNRNEAREAAVLCCLGARQIGLDYLTHFYLGIVRLVEAAAVEAERFDAIASRERVICGLMPTERLRRQAECLLQRMNVVPSGRRLSIVPGCKPTDKTFKLPCSRSTIRDAATKRRTLRQQRIAGWVDFQDYR